MSLNVPNPIIIETVPESNESDLSTQLNNDVNNNNLNDSTQINLVFHEKITIYEHPQVVLTPCREESPIEGTTPLSTASLNVSSCFKLKGILKKPRSYSYSESETFTVSNEIKSNHRNSNHFIEQRKSFCSSGCNSIINDETSDTCGSKKCVSFNNQVIRNIFKPGSTIVGMKKPNTNKNRKKNKRKRTLSDPSHDKTSEDESCISRTSFTSLAYRRSKSISESSDDNSSIVPTTSDDTSHDSHCSHDSHDSNAPSDTNSNQDDSLKKKKKRRRKKKNKINDSNKTDTLSSSTSKDAFNMELLAQEAKNISNN